MNYALINNDTNMIENIILWDGVSDYAVDPAYILIHIDSMPWNIIGNIYTNIDPG